MVGFVLVSHSQKLAEGAKELGLMMAPDVPAEAAGGTADGGLGTDYQKIWDAVEAVGSSAADGVIIIADMGSSRMTAEMVLEDRGEDASPPAFLADCAFVEGTVLSMVNASCGMTAEQILAAAREEASVRKQIS